MPNLPLALAWRRAGHFLNRHKGRIFKTILIASVGGVVVAGVHAGVCYYLTAAFPSYIVTSVTYLHEWVQVFSQLFRGIVAATTQFREIVATTSTTQAQAAKLFKDNRCQTPACFLVDKCGHYKIEKDTQFWFLVAGQVYTMIFPSN